MSEAKRLLDLAAGYDKVARQYRKEAGAALIEARSHGHPRWRGELDQRTAELLINLAVGRTYKVLVSDLDSLGYLRLAV